MTLINPRFSNPVCDILSKNLNYIQQKFGVTRIGLLGSYARGEQSSKSDVDILVDFLPGEATFNNFMQLAYFLEELLSKRVDILTNDGISKHLRPYIEKEVIWIEG